MQSKQKEKSFNSPKISHKTPEEKFIEIDLNLHTFPNTFNSQIYMQREDVQLQAWEWVVENWPEKGVSKEELESFRKKMLDIAVSRASSQNIRQHIAKKLLQDAIKDKGYFQEDTKEGKQIAVGVPRVLMAETQYKEVIDAIAGCLKVIEIYEKEYRNDGLLNLLLTNPGNERVRGLCESMPKIMRGSLKLSVNNISNEATVQSDCSFIPSLVEVLLKEVKQNRNPDHVREGKEFRSGNGVVSLRDLTIHTIQNREYLVKATASLKQKEGLQNIGSRHPLTSVEILEKKQSESKKVKEILDMKDAPKQPSEEAINKHKCDKLTKEIEELMQKLELRQKELEKLSNKTEKK